MRAFDRQELILDRVAAGQPILIEALVEATGASASTVRRDIHALENAGQVVSLRGGAIRAADRAAEIPAALKSRINRDEKIAIARRAAGMVRAGDTIYVDSGTSLTEFMLALPAIEVHVITTNTHLLGMTFGTGVSVTALGGDYLPAIGSIAGTITDRQLQDLYFDRAFIGVTGLHRDAGVTTFDIREANKKAIVQSHSRDTVVLADSSKFDVISLCRSFALSDCTVVSDRFAPLLEEAKDFVIAPAIGSGTAADDGA